jgi:hypothetical protein
LDPIEKTLIDAGFPVIAKYRRTIEELKSRAGHSATREELEQLGFLPLTLAVSNPDVDLGYTRGCEWDTLGEVPDAPGVYLFTAGRGSELRVMYAGETGHLWMVTKGRLPRGEGRGGNRYGRPRNAPPGRVKVNALLADRVRTGWTIRHWVRPLDGERGRSKEQRRREEEQFIGRWDLRRVGWNQALT